MEPPLLMTPGIRVANAPCSWGALEFESGARGPSFVRVLDEIASTGYEGTELGDWGFMPTDPARLREELDRRRLSLMAAFVPVRLSVAADHAPGIESALRVAGLLAAAGDRPFIVLSDDTASDPARTKRAGRIRPADGLADRDWDTAAAGAEAIARAVRETTGLRTVFHNHCATFVEAPWEIEALMQRTDPSLVGLCLDTGHCAFGGGDAVAAVDQWHHRIWHMHFKDCEPGVKARAAAEEWGYLESVRQGVFCELGQGQVDFAAVLARLRSAAYDGWIVVEQDVLPSMGTPAESAQRNRDYLRSLGI